MLVLITGSWRQHSSRVVADCIAALDLIGAKPTRICTGGWVGADSVVAKWAVKNDVPMVDGYDIAECDAIVWINCGKNTQYEQKAMDQLQAELRPFFVW
ncbi:hypothetical protein ACO0LM_11960 [Undibacterium sp. Di26W]|uniref:hypothetical protein n=1 Tax=Undibacterium sp. Di26W TaxID=3413035 RepID=UPI003BF39A88